MTLAEADEPWGSPGSVRDVADRCGYSWVFVPAFKFGDGQPAGGFGNVLLTTLPIRAVQQWQLLWPPRLYDGSEPSEPRSATVALLGSAERGPGVGRDHAPAPRRRPRQGRTERSAASRAHGALAAPWLTCGDFNTAAESWPGTTGRRYPRRS